ncbi:MAG: tRNA (5-methylaminomethyl-2-thiouridine)(34)-methyltransferase MnmD [Cytophagales bacterium]|nr:tRNA (5-methylaminomethyl-2-thiouridine)(34)-methyltransferase MnmD [Bernardetiaceae bacterium]MDW8204958.1 tRNA (5-methylaminomethyl-2-thiouridine)(34)-methyltransferase MnmD [Cytophagales bacterium]
MKHLEVQIVLSADGSHTLYRPDIDEFYHSRYGALGESRQVYAQYGLAEAISRYQLQQVQVLELGFGTGLNVLAVVELLQQRPEIQVVYHSLEPFPLPPEVLQQLNYTEQLPVQVAAYFDVIHQVAWETPQPILPNLQLVKSEKSWQQASFAAESFDVIFYDAFAPEKQPELWEPPHFERAFCWLKNGGILTTYCSKSAVIRTMKTVGFHIEKLSGRPFKREVTRATKMIES